MLKDLVKIANALDLKGLRKEADYLDAIIKVASAESESEQAESEQAKAKSNLKLLDNALGILGVLRMEMDPGFGPQEMPEEEQIRRFEEEEDARSLMEESRLRRDLGF